MDLAKKRKLEENGVDYNIKLTVEDARKIIEPFTQDQLLEIVQNVSVSHLDVLNAVRSIADRDPTQRKLFIRGLGWETTSENLRSLFATYGDLEEAIVILDKQTGKSKGYGFVTYKHIDGALLALKEPSKKIDVRMTVTQLASAGITGPTSANLSTLNDVSNRKIYVANVPYDMPGERLLAHFSSYGEVEEGPLGFDKSTGKSKGFALFVYKTPEAARASLVDPIKTIDGHQLNCKLAIDGKRGKPPGGAVQVNQGQGGIKAETNLDGQGLNNNNQPGSVPALFASQYGGGGPGGISPYGGFLGRLQSGHSLNPVGVNSALGCGTGLSSFGGGGGARLSSIGSQAAAAASLGGGSAGFGSGLGGPYGGGGGSHFAGPGSNYGGLGGAGGGLASGAGGGLGGAGTGLGGVGTGLGRVGTGLDGTGCGSMFGLPPSSAGGYAESAHYSLSSGLGYQGQHHQTTGSSSLTRVPPGGMYQGGIPPYY